MTVLIEQSSQSVSSGQSLLEQEEIVGTNDNGHYYQAVNPRLIPDAPNNQWAKSVVMNFSLIDNYQAQLIVQDANDKNPYYVSEEAFARPVLSFESTLTQLGFSQQSNPYSFNLSNIYNGETIISTQKRKLLVSDKFSEIGFTLPSQRIYGLGQHNSQFQLQNGTYTLYSRGRQEGLPVDLAEGGQNGPHIHPFILGQTQNKDFYGIFFAGSAAQSFEIIYYDDYDNPVINYISLGGRLEIYFIIRGTATQILQKYHQMIGLAQVPPYYALGFFQGSDSYKTLDQVNYVISNYTYLGMAIEGVFIDAYTQPNQPFEVNSAAFPCTVGTDCLKSIHDQDMHVILAVDSGLVANNSNYNWTDGLKNKYNCTVKSAMTNKPLVGFQDDYVIYPDYYCDNIQQFYTDGLERLNNQMQFDAIYVQNNYPFNFIDGEYTGKLSTPAQSEEGIQTAQKRMLEQDEETIGTWTGSYLLNTTQTDISTYNLPFIPGYYWSGNLDNESISLNATHANGWSQIYLHNINGHTVLKNVHQVMTDNTVLGMSGNRPYIFSDSTWPGSGAKGAAVIKDVWRTWDNLRNVISMVMSFSLYGVSNVATDICGSLGQIDEQLCGRWAQVAAFLPLIRNYYPSTHYNFQTGGFDMNDPSEFYTFKDFDAQMMASSALNQRLEYTRYIYSQMYKVYLEGGALVKPLFFDYPNDDNLFTNIEHTFMLGESIKVSPVLDKDVGNSYSVYFPEGKWADLNKYNVTIISNGSYHNLTPSSAQTNIHLKAGQIIPFQQNTASYKKTIDFQTKLKMSFIIHRDDSQYAEGYILVDDGISANSFDDIEFTFWKIRYAEKSINFWVDWGDFYYELPEDRTIDQLEEIKILNAFDLSGTNFACYLGLGLDPVNMSTSYDPYNDVLTIKPKNSSIPLRFRDIGFIKFGNSFQEPNFCDKNSAFTYKVTQDNVKNTTTELAFKIASMQGTRLLEELMVSVKLLDDLGTINLNITTVDDYYNDTLLFKPSHVTDFSYFAGKTVTKDIKNFFTYTTNPFSYKIHPEYTPQTVFWESDPNKLYFSDVLVFDSGIFSMNDETGYPLMGIGERAGALLYNETDGIIHSRYTFDQANPIDNGRPPGNNMYGYQPFYAYQHDSTSWIGVFDLNSYATDYILNYNGGTNTQMTKIVIGGMIQKYFFMGTKPDHIITTYQRLVGMPLVPPLWTFGWQQCRFGWQTDEVWYQVVQNYTANDLPLDTMWADIDYMDDYKIFTISQEKYSHLASNVSAIRAKGMTFVPIMDVGVAVRTNANYLAYEKGMDMDIFIKQAKNKDPLTVGVWCGNAYFPDFVHPNITQYWHSMFDSLNSTYGLQFDGIWIDMNEATNFCNGYCIPEERPQNSLRNKPYYVPGWRDLEDKALGVDGYHANGWQEFDMHSTYSLYQVMATSSYLTGKGLRPFVLSRSNFPGMGKYGFHWMGDNWSTVDYMKLSVDGVYSYNLFGLPFMGSDICGFDGDAEPDLCTRWHQLGSLYPFARNHNQNATAPQEPYRFNTAYQKGSSVTYTDIIRSALRNRYSYIKYYYANFQDIYYNGGSFFKPLFYEWTNDPLAYKNLEINIMLGDALKASIQTEDLLATETTFYFPSGSWCQVLPYLDPSQCFTSAGDETTGNKKLTTSLPEYYIHLRAGYMIPYQNGTSNKVKTTNDLKVLNTDLIVYPNTANSQMTLNGKKVSAAAIGYLYYDDGITLNQVPTRFNIYLTLNNANDATLTVTQGSTGKRLNQPDESVGYIYILQAKSCKLDGVTKATATDSKSKVTVLFSAAYNKDLDMLVINVSDPSKNHLSLYDIATIALSAA